jgi:hypothetical protein
MMSTSPVQLHRFSSCLLSGAGISAEYKYKGEFIARRLQVSLNVSVSC